ncbi:MAG: hypothetical protein SGILL_009609, partial [Bacillariaceae sp.]
MATNKVNPFELDPYDEWDDGGGYGGDDQEEGYAAEDQRLMMDEYYTGGRNTSNTMHNKPLAYQSYDRQSTGKRTFYAQGFGSSPNHHQPQLWKYVLLAVVLVVVLIFWSDKSNERSGDDYISLIDEIPKDEYRIVILGERHSGTSWLHDRLHECYPQAEVSTTLQRPGYFFQHEASSKQEQQPHPQDTIVLHLTLNIYDWQEQMRSSPEYAPNHVGVHDEGHIVPLPWHEFLLRPWAMDRPDRDSTFHNETGPVCQLGFHFNQVVSCVETPMGGTDNPIYELNGNKGGKPYESIIEMRADKLKNHQQVKKWKNVKKFITVPYETAGKEFKATILDEIEDFAGWKASCSGNVLPPTREHSATMTKEMVQFVTQVTDWEAEALVSYEPWTEADIESKGIKDDVVVVATDPPKATTAPKSKHKEKNKKKPATKAPKTAPNATTAPASTVAPASKTTKKDATASTNSDSLNADKLMGESPPSNSSQTEMSESPSNVTANAATNGGGR